MTASLLYHIGAVDLNSPALIAGYFIILAAGIFLAIRYYIRYTKELRLIQSGIDEIDRMEGEEFEEFLKTFFQAEGLSAELTTPEDRKADIILTDRHGRKTAVQARRSEPKKRVGKQSVRELLEAKSQRGYSHAMIVTNSRFTKWANDFARENNVELWDRDALMRQLIKKGGRIDRSR